MEKIYVIHGGGQQVRANVQKRRATEVVEYESAWPQEARCSGQDHFSRTMWNTDLDRLVEQAAAWADVPAGKLRYKIVTE